MPILKKHGIVWVHANLGSAQPFDSARSIGETGTAFLVSMQSCTGRTDWLGEQLGAQGSFCVFHRFHQREHFDMSVCFLLSRRTPTFLNAERDVLSSGFLHRAAFAPFAL